LETSPDPFLFPLSRDNDLDTSDLAVFVELEGRLGTRGWNRVGREGKGREVGKGVIAWVRRGKGTRKTELKSRIGRKDV
jgi:hypothetical protein